MSGIETLLYFVIGFAIFNYGAGKFDSKIVIVLAIIAIIGLHIEGPHTFLFGLILATGWSLLNTSIERIFPSLN